MSIKSGVLAVAAAMTMASGVSAVALLPAEAATPSCGYACISISSAEFGTNSNPNFLLDVYRQGEKAGTPVILYRASNSDPAEDFTYVEQGTVNDFYTAGLVSAALDVHYGSFKAYELEYSPYGVDSGLCMGVGSTAGNGTPVALEPCGASPKTVWVVDSANRNKSHTPLINGSDTSFSNPYVLHYPGGEYPTDVPRPQLNTYTLQVYANSPPTVYNNEMWTNIAPRCGTVPLSGLAPLC
jgi:hypothetical protein